MGVRRVTVGAVAGIVLSGTVSGEAVMVNLALLSGPGR
jgi:hypothetical protein